MKKLIALILVLSILMAFAACGEMVPSEDIDGNAETAATAGKVEPEEEGEEKEEVASVQQPDFPETIIVDDENCTVKITSIEADDMWGYTLKVYLENKTDLNLMYSLDQVSVNGYMCDPFWATTVNAGMKANEDISFTKESFKECGITDVTDITFKLRVYDDEDWTADALVEDMYVIYPLGEDAAQVYTREAQPDDVILFDTEDCTMIVTGYDPDGLFGYTVNVFILNKTDENLMFSIGDAAVNGFMCDPFWATEVAAGKMAYSEISWLEDDFEANGITEVETLTLPIRVYNSDDWAEAEYVSDTFELNP